VAFRKKALETHPDRARAIGTSETELTRRFKEVTLAYEILKPVIKGERKIL
jgi:DnaJ-class molecular chaperone